jgi:hypothetical protein
MKQLKDIDIPLSPAEQARLKKSAKAWIERKDPAARDLSAADQAKSEIAKAEAEKFKRRVQAHNNELILREYKAAGLEPKTDGAGNFVSLALVRVLYPKQDSEGEAA